MFDHFVVTDHPSRYPWDIIDDRDKFPAMLFKQQIASDNSKLAKFFTS